MKKALITGGGGGLGLATAKYLSDRGWTIYAADYNQEALDQIQYKNVIPIQVDVSSDDSVRRAVEEVKTTTDSLDAIVNFAGIMAMGSVIENDVETMRRILDINLLGMYRMNRAFFDLIQNGKGRIINISSEYGTLGAVPFNGFYTTAKHAVEMYSDALRRELLFLDIPVVKIRPGAFRTHMESGTSAIFDKALANTTHYKAVLGKMRTMMEKKTGIAKDPAVLAKTVYRALTATRPRLVYSANLNKSQKFMSCLPERTQDRIYKKLFK
ncbi:MAG TPA: SDR family NAD(P)-dependent oxidoreductase [Candidatus Limiplasma sp.]|nr:SDR family NAD(P)-dependent oxidoreductase [Candidatus Limiplasma sp.]